MAGSLNHIINEDGTFSMDCIDNMGDATEALHECFHIILQLSGGDSERVSSACRAMNFPDPFEIGEGSKKSMQMTPAYWMGLGPTKGAE